MSMKLPFRAVAVAGALAAATLIATPALASTHTAARPAVAQGSAQPLTTHQAGPYKTETACAVAEGAIAASGATITRNCFREAFSSPVGENFEWFFDYSVFF